MPSNAEHRQLGRKLTSVNQLIVDYFNIEIEATAYRWELGRDHTVAEINLDTGKVKPFRGRRDFARLIHTPTGETVFQGPQGLYHGNPRDYGHVGKAVTRKSAEAIERFCNRWFL